MSSNLAMFAEGYGCPTYEPGLLEAGLGFTSRKLVDGEGVQTNLGSLFKADPTRRIHRVQDHCQRLWATRATDRSALKTPIPSSG